MKARLLFLHALSPLHAGTGQGVGAVDLPIARERATGIPIVPGSTMKGVLRTNCPVENDLKVRVFGPETEYASDHAGSAQFSDLRLLFLPVRSLAGTFAWVTSPLLLRRFQRDCQMTDMPLPGVPSLDDEEQCLISSTGSKLPMEIEASQNQVVLEDLRLSALGSDLLDELTNWLSVLLFGADTSWQTVFAERLCVVHDDVLGFLLDTATEITARIRLEETRKTVEQGALWYEEALPAETILSGLMIIQEIKATESDVLEALTGLAQRPLQVGGSATVGRGLCRLHLVP